ncbi:MAG: protein kinase [Lysobacteraceae bacterium]
MTDADWTRVSALLDELFDLDADACAARLAQIADEDPALAARLRKMLEADAASGVLDEVVARVAPTVMERLSEPEPDAFGDSRRATAAPGRQLGHYQLVERIGAGGMGEVWRGERVDDFEQAVAIKLIRPLMDSPGLRERFARERRILARLDHPNIARLLDGGVSEDGTPWYAMEFVRGEDIVSYARNRELDVRGRVELLLQVCDATAQAQSQLIVHRDLKPSNLLVDDSGRVRVLDFGIARLLDDSADVNLTGTGVRVYSPVYAAPEQIRGDLVGTAADVFAMGAVLFELLTGEPPHPQRSAAPERLLAGLDQETAPRPSQSLRERSRTPGEAGLPSLARDLDGDIDQIVATALHPEAARRYAGAAQLGDDLRRWLDGHPIAARADTAGYRMRRFVARHRLAVGSASAVLLALVAGLGLALWQASVARDQAARADAETQRMERTYRFVMSMFNAIQPARGGGQNQQQTVEMLLRDGLGRMDDELADMPDVRAGLRASWSDLLISLGHLDEGLASLEQAVAEYEALSPDADGDLASALINVAGAYKDAARPDDAEVAARKALRLLESGGADKVNERTQARTVLANLATFRFRSDEAIALHEQILEDRRHIPGLKPFDLAVNYNNLASAYLYGDRFVDAERLYRDLDQLLRDSPESPPSRRVYSLSGIAWSLLGQARLDEALQVTDEMQAIGRETLSEKHDLVVNGQTLRARVAMARGEYDLADRLFADAIPRMTDSTASIALLNWGGGLIEQGRHAEAIERLQQATEVFASSQRADSPPGLLCTTLLETARAYRNPDATASAQAALERFDALGLQRSDDGVRALLAVAELLSSQGNQAEAASLARRAGGVSTELLGARHPLTRLAEAIAAGP